MVPSSPTAFRRALLAWYDAEARDLPWRNTLDPYRVWVSEVMLQQTRVETVVPYYLRWMERFPDLESLAEAPEEEVLGAWAGLGYYSRARNLHRGVQVVRERYDGAVPADPVELRALPGVGEYTAGAVASIAFGVAVPAVDGNVRRVMARLTDTPDPTPGELRAWAAAQVDPVRPGDFNQALMELGATTCTPRTPRCEQCPVLFACRSAAAGSQGERPLPRRRPSVREVEVGVALLVTGAGEGVRVLVRQRPSTGLLASMWEFPGDEVAGPVSAASVMTAGRRAALGLVPAGWLEGVPGHSLPSVPHQFSHLRAIYHPVVWHLAADRSGGGWQGRWMDPRTPGDLPLPVAQRRILEQLVSALEEARGPSHGRTPEGPYTGGEGGC